MTVVVAVKVYDGIVLATDSATALPIVDGAGNTVDHQVWNNADKLFQLHRDLSIGLATWGRGQIQAASIATIAKDLRRRLMGRDPTHADWSLDPDNYSLSDVAERLVQLMYDELDSKTPRAQAMFLGFILAGYSAGLHHPEAWEIKFSDPNQRPVPHKFWDVDDVGWWVAGQPDAACRLFNGFSPSFKGNVLAAIDPAQQPTVSDLFAAEGRPCAIAPMPFADAIALAKFCALLSARNQPEEAS
jgi:hypothetical protein